MVSHLIQRVNKIYAYRKTLKGYWPYFLLVFYIFSSVVNTFHDNLNSSLYESVDSEGFFLLVIIVPPLLLYSLIYHAFPLKLQGCDFRGFLLHENRKIIFSLAFVWGGFTIARSMIEQSIDSGINPITIYFETWKEAWFIIPNGFTLLALIIAFVENETLIKSFAVLSFLAMVLFFFII